MCVCKHIKGAKQLSVRPSVQCVARCATKSTRWHVRALQGCRRTAQVCHTPTVVRRSPTSRGVRTHRCPPRDPCKRTRFFLNLVFVIQKEKGFSGTGGASTPRELLWRCRRRSSCVSAHVVCAQVPIGPFEDVSSMSPHTTANQTCPAEGVSPQHGQTWRSIDCLAPMGGELALNECGQ